MARLGRFVSVIAALALVGAACSSSSESSRDSAPTSGALVATTIPAATTTTAKQTQEPSPSNIEVDWAIVESTASGFMMARQERDIAEAQTYLHQDVFFDWGPTNGYDGLADAWAWEDAFRLTQTLEDCQALADSDEPIARCRLRVDSEVAEAAGHEAGFVCIDVTVENSRITQVIALDSENGCSYNYWSKTFQPFAGWLVTAHPDTNIDEMYRDRISADGLELWRQYTTEYLADNNP